MRVNIPVYHFTCYVSGLYVKRFGAIHVLNSVVEYGCVFIMSVSTDGVVGCVCGEENGVS
jgi:hypothetical protein